jgi:hypothetical protein
VTYVGADKGGDVSLENELGGLTTTGPPVLLPPPKVVKTKKNNYPNQIFVDETSREISIQGEENVSACAVVSQLKASLFSYCEFFLLHQQLFYRCLMVEQGVPFSSPVQCLP